VLRVAGALAVGITWMLGLMHAWGVDFNVFNQAVLATIIGVGIDNVVHIEHRYTEEGPGSVARVMATTGSAALLASLTTAIGFGAAIIARHAGIRSLGLLAITGLVCAFVATTVLFPAALRLLERARARQANSPEASARITSSGSSSRSSAPPSSQIPSQPRQRS
jgi:predicted RND superfamily exporter protein